MRRERGHVTFGGTVAYVPQQPWIRNATLRQNVVFGQMEVKERWLNSLLLKTIPDPSFEV